MNKDCINLKRWPGAAAAGRIVATDCGNGSGVLHAG